MDKRWIYIIIILIVGISALYAIASSSTTVGRAIVDVNTFTLTLPDSFSISDTDKLSAELINKNTQEYINITDCGKGNSTSELFLKDINWAYDSGEYEKIENKTTTYNNITINTVYMFTENNTVKSSTYFVKFNHTFHIKSAKFHDQKSIDENIEFIIDTLQIDYKQSQD